MLQILMLVEYSNQRMITAIIDTHYGIRCKRPVHQLVCEAWNGPAPSNEHIVCHRDDVKLNNVPSNLYWGTRLTNGNDSRINGRSVRGERVNTAKLNVGQVITIRQRAAAGEQNRALGFEFGVPDTAISSIVRGKCWKHVGGPIITFSRKGRNQYTPLAA